MAETEKVKSNRERYMERLKSKYPDRQYADDEAVYGQISLWKNVIERFR